MVGKMLAIAVIGLIGVIAPFLIASKVLNFFYTPAISGIGPPLAANIAGFGIAALIAATAFYIALRAVKSLRSTSVVAEGIEEPEELPE